MADFAVSSPDMTRPARAGRVVQRLSVTSWAPAWAQYPG